jgi:hypothetical protein
MRDKILHSFIHNWVMFTTYEMIMKIKTATNWVTIIGEKIMKKINIQQVPFMPRWLICVAVILAVCALSAAIRPALASESHYESCTDYVGDIIKKYNLKPSGKTINKAMRLCMDFKESDAKKVLLKSPRRSTGKAVRNVMGRCLDVAGGVNANRTNVQIFECNGTKSQRWTFTSRKEIRNDMGRCLEVAGGVNANRTNVQIFECNGTKSQKWTFNSRKEIRNDMGRSLEVAGGVNANRTNAQIFECNGTKSQKWRK